MNILSLKSGSDTKLSRNLGQASWSVTVNQQKQGFGERSRHSGKKLLPLCEDLFVYSFIACLNYLMITLYCKPSAEREINFVAPIYTFLQILI